MNEELTIADLLPVYAVTERGAYLTLPLPDGRAADIVPRIFGQAQIAVSRDMKERRFSPRRARWRSSRSAPGTARPASGTVRRRTAARSSSRCTGGIENGAVSFDEEMLAHVVIPGTGQTLGNCRLSLDRKEMILGRTARCMSVAGESRDRAGATFTHGPAADDEGIRMCGGGSHRDAASRCDGERILRRPRPHP